MSFTIQKITAFVATDKGEIEGIMACLIDNGTWVPLICADEARIASMYSMAQYVRRHTGQEFRVIQFSQREDITDEMAAKYDNKEP